MSMLELKISDISGLLTLLYQVNLTNLKLLQ